MRITDDFLTQAQAVIDDFFQSRRPLVMEMFGKVDEEIKQDNSPVTAVDKQLETELREVLTKFDKDIGFEGEEFGQEGDRQTFWLIDPIDGTEAFIRGLPYVRHMVTLIDDGQPVYAYVRKPITQDLFTARKGKGSYKNDEPLQVSRRPLNRCWLELSIKYRHPGSAALVKAVEEVIAAYRLIGDFTIVPEGKEDGLLAYKSGGGPWDYAPRALLAMEAGAKVTNLGSDRYDYRDNNFLALHETAFDELMPIITEALKEQSV